METSERVMMEETSETTEREPLDPAVVERVRREDRQAQLQAQLAELEGLAWGHRGAAVQCTFVLTDGARDVRQEVSLREPVRVASPANAADWQAVQSQLLGELAGLNRELDARREAVRQALAELAAPSDAPAAE